MPPLELKRFDIQRIRDKTWVNILILGKRNSGKSVTVNDIVSNLAQLFPLVIAMSGSEKMNGFYKKILPEMLVYDDVYVNKIRDLISRQEKFIQKIDSGHAKYNNCNPNAALILDDCIHNKEWTKDESARYLSYAGRHIKLTVIIASQELKALPPGMRANFDYVFISRMDSGDELDKIRKAFFACIRNKKDFDQIFNKYTDDYKFIVVDQMTKSTDPLDKIFWYKSDINLKPKLGHPYYYELNNILSDKIFKNLYVKEKNNSA
jgi:hypothetical protein